MGTVYLANNVASGRSCAVKMMRPEQSSDPSSASDFESEIRVLRQLKHAGIPRLLDWGRTEQGHLFFAMEHVAGQNLDDVVRQNGPLNSREVIHIMTWVASALNTIHAGGFVHHDVKPSNIIVSGSGSRMGAVTLIDFGLTRSAHGGESGAARRSGAFRGSPLYAPPESCSGAIDPRSDLYSLGATAYHLLTGRPVFDERHAVAAILAHASQEPVSVRHVRPDVIRSLEAIVMKCLSKDPGERFQSADELLLALEKIDLRENRRPRQRRRELPLLCAS